MTVRKAISAAVSAHADAVKAVSLRTRTEVLLDLNRKAEQAVSLVMQAAGDDAALTEKIVSRLWIKGDDGKLRLPLLGDEIEDRRAFIAHHQAAARAIASAANARRSSQRA